VDELARVLVRDNVGTIFHELDSFLQKFLTSTEQEVGGAGLALRGYLLHVREDLPLFIWGRYLRISALDLLIDLRFLRAILSLLSLLFVG
jgi:hypothetical protein